MGLAANQIRLLTLTARKSDVEYGISINSMQKMAILREQSDLSRLYYSKLQAKNISYYANGQYNKVDYGYLMGNTNTWLNIMQGNGPLKGSNKMVLSDYKGQVILDNTYADAITKVLGSGAMDANGRGGTFSLEKIPEMLATFLPYSADQIQNVIDGGLLESSYNTNNYNQISGEYTGSSNVNNSEEATNIALQIISFYYPIFTAAAANGWTTEYNQEWKNNNSYISDALASGTLMLASVDNYGNYDPDATLTYFVTSGLVTNNTTSDMREEITAWYEAEKHRIAEKEEENDIEMRDLSTELEAINTEIQAVKSLLQEDVEVLNWGA